MLIRVIFQNILSFNQEMQFDMLPNTKRQSLRHHVINTDKLPLLKMAAIYGPNGAGKSNIVKALSVLRGFAINKEYFNVLKAEGDFDRLFFSLKKEIQPFSLLVEFSNNGQYFIYSIEVSRKAIEKEELYSSGIGRKENELIFQRHGSTIAFGGEMSKEVSVAAQKMLERNRLSSLLSLNNDFPILQDNRINTVYEWFKVKLELVGINSRIPSLLELLRSKKDMLEYTNQIFKKMGLGIDQLSISEEDFDNWAATHQVLSMPLPDKKSRENKSIALFRNQTQAYTVIKNKVYKFLFKQAGENGYEGDLDAISQSDGTIRLLTLVPAIYDCVKKDKTVVIDEINNCLHPTLVEGIVRLFADELTSKGQLIFTTHDIELLDVKDIIRSDEIWFADKREGSTILYSHNIFKEHNTMSILRGYKEGRFGAIKYMD